MTTLPPVHIPEELLPEPLASNQEAISHLESNLRRLIKMVCLRDSFGLSPSRSELALIRVIGEKYGQQFVKAVRTGDIYLSV